MGVEQAEEYLGDLASYFQFQVEQADRARGTAATSALLDELDDDDDLDRRCGRVRGESGPDSGV